MQTVGGSQGNKDQDQIQSQQYARDGQTRPGVSGADGRIQADHGVISS